MIKNGILKPLCELSRCDEFPSNKNQPWWLATLDAWNPRFNQMGVSKNRGTPKSSILIGFFCVNHPFWGTPIYTQMVLVSLIPWKGGHIFFWNLQLLHQRGGKDQSTPWKINMEPTNYPFREENYLPSLHDYVPAVNLQGCNIFANSFREQKNLTKIRHGKNFRYPRISGHQPTRGSNIKWAKGSQVGMV